MSSVASGGQANRTGANGEVPRPAETCNHEARAPVGGVLRQPLCPARLEVAVGHQCAPTGNAQLPSMGVTGEEQPVPIGRHRIENPPVRRVGHADAEVSRRRRPGDVGVTVHVHVRIVDPSEAQLPGRR